MTDASIHQNVMRLQDLLRGLESKWSHELLSTLGHANGYDGAAVARALESIRKAIESLVEASWNAHFPPQRATSFGFGDLASNTPNPFLLGHQHHFPAAPPPPTARPFVFGEVSVLRGALAPITDPRGLPYDASKPGDTQEATTL